MDTLLHDPARLLSVLPDLPNQAVGALPYLWDVWALPHQRAPQGAWRSWVILGGRGAGKTRAGAEWVRSMVEGPRPRDPGRCRRVALVAETLDQAREVMVMGPSGILACSPPDRRPEWIATRRILRWPNGAEAQIFSAHEPEALRGPQFDCAWVDELAKWKRPDAWDQLQFALRLGDDPRACVTTTPRNVALLRDLLARSGTVITHAATAANAANLAPGFVEEVRARYGNTRLGRQEIDGLLLDDADGALWTPATIETNRADAPAAFDRVVVAVDPAASSKNSSDATGIVVVGAVTKGPKRDWRAYVLEDATVEGASPQAWGRAVASAARRWGADRVVVESNQGGDMVSEVLRGVDPDLPVRPVHARHSKGVRAEPVAALYERGQVHHARAADLRDLEAQMESMTVAGFRGRGSPDRVDALVWALHEALLAPQAAEPSARLL